MKSVIFAIILVLVVGVVYFIYSSSRSPDDLEHPPKFCTHDFTELWKIKEISKFRSFEGHDYSDSFEHGLSMKHYYMPKEQFGNSNDEIRIFSPVNGTISYLMDEGYVLPNGEIQGKQMGIRPDSHPDFTIILFHINPFKTMHVGRHVKAGEQIGYVDARYNSAFDIAVSRRVGLFKEKLYSYFQVMDGNVFSEYKRCGIKSRDEMIKSKEEVDRLVPNWDQRNESDWVKLSCSASKQTN